MCVCVRIAALCLVYVLRRRVYDSASVNAHINFIRILRVYVCVCVSMALHFQILQTA